MAKALSAKLVAMSISSGPLATKSGGTRSPVRGLVAPNDSPPLVPGRNPTIDCPDIFKALSPELLWARHLAAHHLRPVLQSLLDNVLRVSQFLAGQFQSGLTHT